MRTAIVLVLALGLVAFAVPATVAPVAEAHWIYCEFGDTCMVKCLAHHSPVTGHRCTFYPVP
jgi:hypothetical protein